MTCNWSYFTAVALLLLGAGCATHERYTSLDLDLLPCEHGSAPRFFHSVEFKADGTPRYPQQVDALERLFSGSYYSGEDDWQRRTGPITEIVVFIHGWSKNPSSAENDYQDFLCRLHGKLRDVIGKEKAEGRLLVIGVFWPSTITNRASEPMLVKPASYFRIRNRADLVARTGVAELFEKIGTEAERSMAPDGIRMQLVGHSFGARMVIGALEKLESDEKLDEFLESSGDVNVVLLNAAVAPDRFRWLTETIAEAGGNRVSDRREEEPRVANSYLFNIHSLNDSATKNLFPMASIFNNDPAVCAAGACGVPGFPTIELDEAGSMVLDRDARLSNCPIKSVEGWNIDATKVVFAHSDIYKGRIAGLLAQLTYDPDIRAVLPRELASGMCAEKTEP